MLRHSSYKYEGRVFIMKVLAVYPVLDDYAVLLRRISTGRDFVFRFFTALSFVIGFFDITKGYHRDRLGIYWRGRRKTCQVPTNLANHEGSKMKGHRSVLKRHAVLIKQLKGTIDLFVAYKVNSGVIYASVHR